MHMTKMRKLTITGLMAAIILLLALTPLGYIPLNPAITVTILVVPVMVGGMAAGLPAGIFLGAVFGLTSLFRAPTEAIGQLMLAQSFWLTFAACLVPRLLVGAAAGLAHHLLQKTNGWKTYWMPALFGFLGSMVNTLGFLGFVSLAFDSAKTGITGPVLLGIVAFNGSIEAVANAVLVGVLARLCFAQLYGRHKPS